MFKWRWYLLLVCIAVPIHAQDRNPSGYEPSPDRVQGRHDRLPKLIEVARLFPSDASDPDGLGHGFGSAAAIEGQWVAAGAHSDSERAYKSGAVYLFRRNGLEWVEHAKIIPDNATDQTFFGSHLTMDQDRLVVVATGGQFLDSVPGRLQVAYVYIRDKMSTPLDLSDDEWRLESKLYVPPRSVCCTKPGGVAIEGDTIAIGHVTGEWSVGEVAVFTRSATGWEYDTALVGSDSQPGDFYGNPVTIKGKWIFIGAPKADGGSSQTGALYVFRKDLLGWVEETKLSASDGAAGDQFGVAFSANGNLVAVGAYVKPTPFGYGHVYVFQRDGRTWTQQADIQPVNPPIEQLFGGMVSLERDFLVVSAFDQISLIQSLYTFSRFGDVWILNQRLEPVDAAPGGGYAGVRDWSGRYLVAAGPGLVYVLQMQR